MRSDMKEYPISVITPFHNTERALFEKTLQSLEVQSIGFSNVEWIIVAHNTEKSILSDLRSMTAGRDNIRVFELNNDCHTASSPRNFALAHATGKYLTFLDSDDQLTKNCLTDLVSGMNESGADIGKYRSVRVEEDKDILSFLDSRVRFDQIRPLQIYEKNDPALTKIVTLSCMMVSCQVLRRDFLEAHALSFRENIRIYEDVVFNLEAMSHASKIAVFPQLIGYVYYMHHGSTMQELGSVPASAVVKTCQDIAFQLRIGTDAGFNMKYLFWNHMAHITEMIESAPDMTREERSEIRTLFLPYFESVEPLEADRKFFTKEQAEELMEHAKTVVLNESGYSNTSPVRVLQQILKHNIATDLGEAYGFDHIMTEEAYRERVPISSYDTYAPLIELTSKVGETDLFCADRIICYTPVYGSIGVPRLIPYTREHLMQYVQAVRGMIRSDGSTFFLADGIKGDVTFSDGAVRSTEMGAMLSTLQDYIHENAHRVVHKAGFFTSPMELLFPQELFDLRHLRLLFALADPDVKCIISPYVWELLETMHYLEQNWQDLIHDLRSGLRIGTPQVPEKTGHALEKKLCPSKERVDELEAIFSEGFSTPIIPRIWKQCDSIIACAAGTFAIYQRRLQKYTGGIPLNGGYYMRAEALMAKAWEGDAAQMILLKNKNYYEFLPFPSSGNGETQTLGAGELSPGSYYEVLVTNRAGLYRYRLGEVIHVEKMVRNTPVFRCEGRTYENLGIPGTDGILLLSEWDRLIETLEEHYQIRIADYCFRENREEKRIELYLEPEGEKLSELLAIPRPALAKKAEELLCTHHASYRKARENGFLQPLFVGILQPDTQLLYRDRLLYRMKCTPDHMRPVRVLDTPDKERFFLAMQEDG